MKNFLTYGILFVVLGLGAFLTYLPHIENPLPLLADEYVHISLAKQLTNEGVLPFTNPYIATETTHANYESGFHFFLAFLFVLLPGEPVLIYQYFATMFFVINGLLLFYLVQLWSKKYVVALFAVFFFGTITSAEGLLAHQYFVPLTLGITLLLTSYILLYKFLSSHQHYHLVMLVGTLLITAITYPPTLFFFLFTAGLYLFLMKHSLHDYLQVNRQTFFMLLTSGSVVLAGLFFTALAYLQLLDEVIFHASWSTPFDEYSLLFFFGIVPTTLGLIGIWSTMQEKSPGSLMVLCWYVYALLALYVFYLFEYTLLVPFPRLFLFFLISISILAGYGVNTIITLIQSQIGYIYKALLIISLGFGISFHMVHVTQTSVQLPTIITTQTYQSLTQFAKQYPADGVIISDPLTSVAVYPIAGNKVVNLLHSNIGGGDSNLVRTFMRAPCAEKPDHLYALQPYLKRQYIQQAPFFVISDQPQNCEFLTLLPESNPSAQLYIYTLREGTLREFLRNNNLAKIPDPTLDSSQQPLKPLKSSTELVELISGNTLVGDTWVEYYQPNGTIIGQTQSGYAYNGVWNIKNGFYCYYYPHTNYSTCLTVKENDDELKFYDKNNTLSSSAFVKPGNHLNLKQY